MTEKSYVFLSYAREDLEFASWLQTSLENAGIAVWRDLTEIRAGQNWLEEIDSALSNCIAFVPLLTPAYVHSQFCAKELFHAYVQKYPIIPVLIWPPNHQKQGYEVPPEIANIQSILFYREQGHRIDDSVVQVQYVHDASTYEVGLRQLIKEISAKKRPAPPTSIKQETTLTARLRLSLVILWLMVLWAAVGRMCGGDPSICCLCAMWVWPAMGLYAAYCLLVGVATNNGELKKLSLWVLASLVASPLMFLLQIFI